MFNEDVFRQSLSSLALPTAIEQIKFDPPSKSSSRDFNLIPTMYLLNAALTTHFYTTETNCCLSIDINEDVTYMASWWFANNKFVITFIDNNELFSDDTINIRDSVRIGNFFKTEEEHFQNDCLNGSVLAWDIGELLKEKCATLIDFYQDAKAELFNRTEDENES